MGLPGNDLSAEARQSAPEGASVPADSSMSCRWGHRLLLGLARCATALKEGLSRAGPGVKRACFYVRLAAEPQLDAV